ncbi:hypothetical protein BX666DRAFT_2033687 [Dichotomocladium elegans]|nr:hypothetical protein BX666DRAFT_2033687 [Dichotomocladium elegans]
MNPYHSFVSNEFEDPWVTHPASVPQPTPLAHYLAQHEHERSPGEPKPKASCNHLHQALSCNHILQTHKTALQAEIQFLKEQREADISRHEQEIAQLQETAHNVYEQMCHRAVSPAELSFQQTFQPQPSPPPQSSPQQPTPQIEFFLTAIQQLREDQHEIIRTIKQMTNAIQTINTAPPAATAPPAV